MQRSLPSSRHVLFSYWELMRFHKPVGIFLLLWPTYWGLWLAAEGTPAWNTWLIFTLGVIVMRAAGCVINDYADRHIDGHVKRTQNRPLVNGSISPQEALALFAGLCLVAGVLVLFTNLLTILLSVGALLLAASYPFMKRYTHLPQVVLGAAFSWSIPMAFAAQTGKLDPAVWLVYFTNLIWTVSYDTFYSMADREYDRRVGVKSTAILFAEHDRLITGCLQGIAIIGWLMIGSRFDLGIAYYGGVAVAGLLIGYQQWLIRHREPKACLNAFLNNNWVGLSIFAGLAVHYASI